VQKKINHLNTKFQQVTSKQVEAMINYFPLAEIITARKDTILVSEIPLLYSKNELIGHIANSNPQLEHFKLNSKLKVIFCGPQAYISPQLFQSEELPTFNFARLHIEGDVSLKPVESTLEDIKRLYQHLDTSTSDLFQAQRGKINELSQYITGFSIKISSIDFRFKLSQDKSNPHQLIALKELEEASKMAIHNYLEQSLKPNLLVD